MGDLTLMSMLKGKKISDAQHTTYKYHFQQHHQISSFSLRFITFDQVSGPKRASHPLIMWF